MIGPRLRGPPLVFFRALLGRRCICELICWRTQGPSPLLTGCSVQLTTIKVRMPRVGGIGRHPFSSSCTPVGGDIRQPCDHINQSSGEERGKEWPQRYCSLC